jgi:hypothetical protein
MPNGSSITSLFLPHTLDLNYSHRLVLGIEEFGVIVIQVCQQLMSDFNLEN